jgi:hypothetical protein
LGCSAWFFLLYSKYFGVIIKVRPIKSGNSILCPRARVSMLRPRAEGYGPRSISAHPVFSLLFFQFLIFLVLFLGFLLVFLCRFLRFSMVPFVWLLFQTFFKFKTCSNSNYVQIRNMVNFEICLDFKFVQFLIFSNLTFIQIWNLFIFMNFVQIRNLFILKICS